MVMFHSLERLASRLAPNSRKLLVIAVAAPALPILYIAVAQQILKVDPPFGFLLASAGVTIAVWALGFFLLIRLFRPERMGTERESGRVLRAWRGLADALNAALLIGLFLASIVMLTILFC